MRYSAKVCVITVGCLGVGILGAKLLTAPTPKMVSIILGCLVAYLITSIIRALR